MTRLWLRCSVTCILLFICVNSYSACSCRNANPDNQKLSTSSPTPQGKIPESSGNNQPVFRFEDVTTSEERVYFTGVSFTANPSLFSKIQAAIVPAVLLDDPTYKPDGYHPKQIQFCFPDKIPPSYKYIPYPPNFEFPSCYPEIVIFKIEDYKQTFSVLKEMVQGIEEDVINLGKLLSKKHLSYKDKIPYLEYFDAHRAFQAHIQRVEFQNGKGILVLTEYHQGGGNTVTNEELAYLFQGITNDGKYSVKAWFPVTVSVFPKDSYEPPFQFRKETAKADEKAYEAHCLRMGRKLDALPPDKFQPALTEIENLVRSIRIEDSLNK